MIASIHLFKAHTPQPIPPVDDDNDDDDEDERKPGSGGGNIDPDDDEGTSDDDDDDDEDETQWTRPPSMPPTCAAIGRRDRAPILPRQPMKYARPADVAGARDNFSQAGFRMVCPESADQARP
jgi:hypothetical protein